MKRRLLCLLLAAALCLTLLPVALAWDADDDWSAAYREFVLEDGFREQGRAYSDNAEYPVRFILFDLDGDLRPELFVRDPLRAMVQDPYDVYTFRDGKTAYIGRIGIRGGELHYAPGRGYDGVFSYDGALGFFIGWYYTMQNGSIVTQRVVESDGAGHDTWITADENLRAAFRAAYDGSAGAYSDKGLLPSFTADEIRDMTWETFALGSGAVARFTDVGILAWYAPAVSWAADEDVTNGAGVGLFVPGAVCTRAQMVTFLWRAAGAPAAKKQASFADVPEGTWFSDAVSWAAEQGITNGTEPDRFSPNAPVTRGQTATFLWRFAGEQAPKGAAPRFDDVSPEKYYAPAIAWALESGVTNGVDATHFAPGQACTRAQIVTFLYRCLVAPLPPDHTADLTVQMYRLTELPAADRTFLDEPAEGAVLITFRREVENVQLLRAEQDGSALKVTGEPLFRANRFAENVSLLVETMFPDAGAHIALRYTVDGETVTFGLAMSGKDGSAILISIDGEEPTP